MIRRVFPYIFLIALAVIIASYNRDTRNDIKVEYGYFKKEPYRVVLETYENRYICNDCGMMVKTYDNSCQVIVPNGNVYFFDDVGCMLRWVDRQKFKEEVKMYVFTHDTKAYFDAKLAWYVRDEPTPLGYGFGAYETSMGAINSSMTNSSIETKFGDFSVKRSNNKEIYEFDEIRLFALRGETLLHPLIKREVLKRD